MRFRSRFATSCLLAASLAVVSCGSDNNAHGPADAGLPDASREDEVGGKLGAALASAAAAANSGAPASPGTKAKGGDQPPENGIFAAGEADKRQAKEAAPKLELIGEGDAPRVQLTSKLDAPEQKTTLSVALRLGQNRLPPIDFSLALKPEKSKTEKAKDAPPESSARMAATVTGVGVSGVSGLPKDFSDALAKLKGSVVRYDFGADGAASHYAVEMAKDAGEGGLDRLLDGLVETMSMLTVALPPKPVGVGAYWIVTDRAKAGTGIDVVRYRVFKVIKIDNGTVTLSLDVRQYSAADQKIPIDSGTGQKTELGLDAFDSVGKGNVIWKSDTFLPIRGDTNVRISAKLAMSGAAPPQGGRAQAPVVQTELTGTLGGGTAVPDEKP